MFPLIEALLLVPFRKQAEIHALHRVPILIVGVKWFVQKTWPLLAMASVGCLATLRHGAGPAQHERPTPASVAIRTGFAWMGAAAVVVLVQTISWWDYHWMLLLTPLAVFAAIGTGRVLRIARAHAGTRRAFLVRLAAGVLLAVGLSGTVPAVARLLTAVAGARALFARDHQAFHEHINARYRDVAREVAFLAQPGAHPGEIYAFGTPLVYLLSGRGEACGIQGWPVDTIPRNVYAGIVDELEEKKPAYVFVEYRPHEAILRQRPEVQGFLAAHYHVDHRGDLGVWYRISD